MKNGSKHKMRKGGDELKRKMAEKDRHSKEVERLGKMRRSSK